MARKSEMACGCDRLETTSIHKASEWLIDRIKGRTNVEISIVVGGDKCSFYRNRIKPFSVGTFGPPNRHAYKEKE